MKYTSIFLTVLWVVYAIVSFFSLAIGNIARRHLYIYKNIFFQGFAVFTLIWCLFNVGCYGLVVLGLNRNNRLYLLPALFLSLFNIAWGVINAIINFFFLAIFS